MTDQPIKKMTYAEAQREAITNGRADLSALRRKISEATEGGSIVDAMMGVQNRMVEQTVQDMYTGNNSNPLAAVANHGMGHYSQQRQQSMPYSQPGMNPVVHGDWEPLATLKETRIGKEVETYRVRNKATGAKFDREYRYHQVAAQVAAILNETGDQNDKRLKKIHEWYDMESSALLEIKKMVGRYKNTDTGNSSRRTILKNQINEKKMVLESVRGRLGVS